MTGENLVEQMLALGGKESFVEEEIFNRFHAVNRAAFEVNRLFPVTRKIQLVNYPLTPVAFYGPIRVHRGGEDITINASGVRSLAFAVSGGGGKAYVYELTNNGERQIAEIEIAESATFITHKYIAGTPKDIRLVFTGAYNYMIRDASFYSELISDRAEDVKLYSPWVAYDIAGKGIADEQSMRNALYMAMDIVRRRREWQEWNKNPLEHFEREKGRDISIKDLPEQEQRD